MSLDQYAPCSCGSGKKFKWCCQPIYDDIDRASELDASGQHDAALRVMEQLTKTHPGNPEAWGQYARLLVVNERTDEAEQALDKAFAINPSYPFGLQLRAVLRFNENEMQGSLLLARQAADAYDPAAKEPLANVYRLIFECEMNLGRGVAARAALEQAMACAPGEETFTTAMENLFGEKSRRPLCARRKYDLLPASTQRRAAWNKVLGGTAAKLSRLSAAFETLTQEDGTDGPAWFNLGLSRAWMGDNKGAIDALERYLDLEQDDEAATTAAALAEVLRCGPGLEAECDHHTYTLVHRLRQGDPLQEMIQEWSQQRRLVPLQTDEQEGVFTALLLDTSPTGLITVGRPAGDGGTLAGYLVITQGLFSISSPLKEPFDRLREEVRQRLALGLGEPEVKMGPARLPDIVAEALLFPTGPGEEEQMGKKVLDHAARFFEDTWIHRQRRSLGNNTPVDAVGHVKLRKKVLGCIRFLQDCSAAGMIGRYDFDRLRRKLGLLVAAPAAGTGPDITTMGAAELAALSLESLADEQLEQAYRTAGNLGAKELAQHFARAIVNRPVKEGKGDRFGLYSYLIEKALEDGESDAALDLVNQGEQGDCTHNEGRRRNEFEQKRARVHARRGEFEACQDVFQRLIDRTPDDLKLRGQAAEEMLKLGQPAKALAFAEAGLGVAKEARNRDMEQYLGELAQAARKKV